MIGVNLLLDDAPDAKIETHAYDVGAAERQIARTRRVRRERDAATFDRLMRELTEVAKDDAQNILPITIELVRAGATMGDITESLKAVWGTYREAPAY